MFVADRLCGVLPDVFGSDDNLRFTGGSQYLVNILKNNCRSICCNDNLFRSDPRATYTFKIINEPIFHAPDV